MQRRLDLGASLVGAPRLLLLDEPTTGLDPRSRNELWVAIENLATRGTDVLLTTQYLDEADRLADTIAIIDHGKLVASGTSNELKSRLGRDVVDVKVADDADLERAAQALGTEASIDTDHARIFVPVTTGAEDLVTAVQALGAAGIPVADIALRQPTLDDVFLTLTGHTTDGKAFDDGDEGTDGDGSVKKRDKRKARA
jgi:ABC-2 type transport system ATP-binding protein